MSISDQLQKIAATLPEQVTLVAVSKTKPASKIQEAYDAGHRIFGENKVQELCEKWEVLPKDIQWHMIGHLQRNKVKYLAGFVHLIHGVDSIRLLREIQKQGAKHNRVISCLLQVHIAKEDTKFGFSEEELLDVWNSELQKELSHVKICGLMGMATFTENQQQVRDEFAYLKKIFDQLKHTHPELNTLSMGMSGDYQIAIEEGSTMVRIGSSIFGVRTYH